MPVVIGVRFKDSGKVYYFDPGELDPHSGDYVVVETVRGLELACVAHERREVAEDAIVGELKPVVRYGGADDFERLRLFQSRQQEVLARCDEKVREHGLPMNLVKAEYSFDGSRLTFYFTAEKRVDFRMLVRDLARTFRSRIELRQIGPRDEAKLLGGIGPCGRVLCCASFLPDYARVSIKMAKDQDLPLNPSKISGVCGRLLCCLSYEHEQYVAMRAELPRRGTWVQTPDGPGEVISQHVLKQQLVVQLSSSGMHETYDVDQVEIATAQVAALARARHAEGITPSARGSLAPERERGERRKLRDEIDHYDLLDNLEQLEDHDLPPPLESYPGARVRPSEPATPAREQQRRPPTTTPQARSESPSKPRGDQPPTPPQLPPAGESHHEHPESVRRRRRQGGRSDTGDTKE